jgi:ankyrin repeat protein
LQDNYNALHIAAMHSREDIVKILLSKKGVDPFAPGGVSKGKVVTRDQHFWYKIRGEQKVI